MAGNRGQYDGDTFEDRLGRALYSLIDEGSLEYADAYGVMMTVLGSEGANYFGPDPIVGLRGVG